MAQIDKTQVEDETEYRVTLSRPIKIGERTIPVGAHELRMTGKFIKDNADSIASVEQAT